MAHHLKFDPDTEMGRAIIALFEGCEEVDWSGGDVVQVLTDWFTRFGIDTEAGPITVPTAADLARVGDDPWAPKVPATNVTEPF